MGNKIKEIAAKYAKAGVYVLPGEVGNKFPISGLLPNIKTISYKKEDYPANPEELLYLFDKHPNSNIIGLAGNDFEVVVIDIDKADGKFSNDGMALIEFLKDYPTYVKATPSNGLNYIYLVDKNRPLVGRVVGYKEGIDIIMDGASPMPPSKAYSKKIGKEGYYTESESIEIQPIAMFPYELFPDLIDNKENRIKLQAKSEIDFNEQLLSGKISKNRNVNLYSFALKQAAVYPNDPDIVRALLFLLYEANVDKNGFPVKELETILQSAYKSRIATTAREESSNSKPKVLFWNQLKDLPVENTEWIVPSLIPCRTISLIYGKPGTYKTYIMMHIAMCAAKGVNLFTNSPYIAKQCKVLFVDKDNDIYYIKERVESLGGLDIDTAGFYTDSSLFKVEDEKSVERLIETIRENNIELVVFDTARDIHKGNEDDSKDMNNVIDTFKRINREGCAVIAIAHSRKSTEGDLIDHLRGSSAIAGTASSMISVKLNGEDRITLELSKSRFAKKIKPLEIRAISGEKGIKGFEYLGIAANVIKNKDSDELASKILEILKDSIGLKRKELLAAIQINGTPSPSTIDRKVDYLVSLGKLERIGEGKDMIIKTSSQ